MCIFQTICYFKFKYILPLYKDIHNSKTRYGSDLWFRQNRFDKYESISQAKILLINKLTLHLKSTQNQKALKWSRW